MSPTLHHRRGVARATSAALLALLLAPLLAGQARAASLRFFGHGVGDIDRVKIRIDDPANPSDPGPPADVGGGDFTIELWLRTGDSNTAPTIACGASNAWIFGNIFFDRDRFNQGRAFGVSLGNGRVAFGALTSQALTICGTTDLRDGTWHHVAVQRRRADGWMWIYVDGRLEAAGDGPDGDLSYPDDGVPGPYCGPGGNAPCTSSDPFIVLGAEKHDAGPAYPSFDGWIDELRLSTTLRYTSASFTPPQAPFTPDAATAALYHFDEPAGSLAVEDSSGNPTPSPGMLSVGGTPPGPQRSADTPFAASAGVLQLGQASYAAAESSGSITVQVSRTNGSAGAVSVDYATTPGAATPGADYLHAQGTLSWADGNAAPREITVALNDDADVEGDEAFGVMLSNPTGGATLGQRTSATLTIADDDAAPVPGAVEFSASSYSVAESGMRATVTVRRIAGGDGPAAVSYATVGGSATADGDYRPVTGTLEWPDGDAADRTFTIDVLDDAEDEPDETIALQLRDAVGASLGGRTAATVVIGDDDAPPAPPPGGGASGGGQGGQNPGAGSGGGGGAADVLLAGLLALALAGAPGISGRTGLLSIR